MSASEAVGSPSPAVRAGFDTREFVRRVAVEAFDATVTEEPIEGSDVLTRRGLDDPLAGVRAALLVHEVAAGQMREWALRARGAGRSWNEVAAGLRLGEDPDTGRSAGEVAWQWLVEHRPPHPPRQRWGHEPASAVWTCRSCGARVRDSGPFASSHPSDREYGHAPGCARHREEIAAWRRETGGDDDEPVEQDELEQQESCADTDDGEEGR